MRRNDWTNCLRLDRDLQVATSTLLSSAKELGAASDEAAREAAEALREAERALQQARAALKAMVDVRLPPLRMAA
jgi:predicted component of type VI protein secretion system